MQLPEDLLTSLQGVAGFDRDAFIQVHQQREGVTSVRVNAAKWSIVNSQWSINPPIEESESFVKEDHLQKRSSADVLHLLSHDSLLTTHHSPLSPVPWCATGLYLSQRPSFTFDPFFAAGCYYVQEASSMFLEQALTQLLDLSKPQKVLDLCAAPGGKSTHIQSLLSPESLLVSNEVIKQRSLVLTDNIIKWGGGNVFITNNDPAAFKELRGYFDVLVADAPCSGSGLFRKDEGAISEWSLHNVALCSGRQQRILAHALPSLKQGGLLVYSTCSYSAEEDEQIMDWLVEEMDMESLSLNSLFDGIVETASQKRGAVGYRFYPDKIRGEGFFLSCFIKKGDDGTAAFRTSKPLFISAKEKSVVTNSVIPDGLQFLYHRDEITAIPENLLPSFFELQSCLNIRYAGTTLGVVLKEKLIPHHALAQSNIISAAVPVTELTYEESIKYLQRQELSVIPQSTGWQVVQYKNANLGWINALPNRINNYYPKALRILKGENNSGF